jgi:hypothetical protein
VAAATSTDGVELGVLAVGEIGTELEGTGPERDPVGDRLPVGLPWGAAEVDVQPAMVAARARVIAVLITGLVMGCMAIFSLSCEWTFALLERCRG